MRPFLLPSFWVKEKVSVQANATNPKPKNTMKTHHHNPASTYTTNPARPKIRVSLLAKTMSAFAAGLFAILSTATSLRADDPPSLTVTGTGTHVDGNLNFTGTLMKNGVPLTLSSTITPATTTTLGGVKVGANLSVTPDGTLSATGGATPATFPLNGSGVFITNPSGGKISIRSTNDEDADEYNLGAFNLSNGARSLKYTIDGYDYLSINDNMSGNIELYVPYGDIGIYCDKMMLYADGDIKFAIGDTENPAMILTPSSNLSLESHKVINLANGTDADDAVNVSQLNAKIQIVANDTAAQSASAANPTVLYLVPKNSSTTGSVWFAGQKIIGP